MFEKSEGSISHLSSRVCVRRAWRWAAVVRQRLKKGLNRAKMGTKMVSFGEAMIRFLPKETQLPNPLPPSAAQDFLR